jgi:hypothetical protein
MVAELIFAQSVLRREVFHPSNSPGFPLSSSVQKFEQKNHDLASVSASTILQSWEDNHCPLELLHFGRAKSMQKCLNFLTFNEDHFLPSPVIAAT